jgi:pSer/pThr/pTyr-binding forkhead associated (FHA) protein
VIFDLNSTGGTHINGQRTSQSVLYPGDLISLAGVKFIFSQELPAKPGEVRIIELGSPYAADRPTAVMHKEKLKPGDKDTSELPKPAPLRK